MKADLGLPPAGIPFIPRLMYRPVQVKICGLCSEADVDLALEEGADYCGFIVYPKSPRGLGIKRAAELASRVPAGRRVLVDVETSTQDLERYRAEGFDYFQIHCGLQVGLGTLAAWSGLVGADRLWLAPRLPPEEPFPEATLEFARTILVDTYARNQVGGTGMTGDWERFAAFRERYPVARWILAGGLSPDNIVEAIAESGAGTVDVNSGIEAAPGRKDPEKLKTLFRRLRPSG